jgi:hypothetical protein
MVSLSNLHQQGDRWQRKQATGAFQIWGNLQKAATKAEVALETSILSLSKDAVLGQKTAVFETHHASTGSA